MVLSVLTPQEAMFVNVVIISKVCTALEKLRTVARHHPLNCVGMEFAFHQTIKMGIDVYAMLGGS
jgi:hypothetical protein